jgi:DNA-binding transcriptional ArsR family regulator
MTKSSVTPKTHEATTK